MIENIQQTVLNKTKQDKFIIIIDIPPALKKLKTRDDRSNKLMNLDKMQFSVAGITVPPHTISEVETPFMGQTMNITSQTRAKYPPAKVTFTIDNNFDNYWFLWQWLYILNNPTTSGMDEHFAKFDTIKDSTIDAMRKDINGNTLKFKEIKMLNKYDDYQTIITLYGLREYNEKIIKFDYSHAFITTLGGFEYNYQNSEDISCSFDFAYGQVEVSLVDPV